MKVKHTVHILSATVAAALQNITRCKYFISSCIYSRIYWKIQQFVWYLQLV